MIRGKGAPHYILPNMVLLITSYPTFIVKEVNVEGLDHGRPVLHGEVPVMYPRLRHTGVAST